MRAGLFPGSPLPPAPHGQLGRAVPPGGWMFLSSEVCCGGSGGRDTFPWRLRSGLQLGPASRQDNI